LFAPVLSYVHGPPHWLASYSPDPFIYALTIVVTGKMLSFISDATPDRDELHFGVFYMTALVFLGMTVKLSFLIVGVSQLLLIWIFIILKRDINVRKGLTAIVLVALAALILVPWVIHGYIISGYPLFPSTFAGFDLEWTVSEGTAIRASEDVTAWARIPNYPAYGYSRAEVLSGTDWMHFFLKELTSQGINGLIQMAGIALLAALLVNLRRLTRNERYAFFAALASMCAGIVFWLVKAPDVRFAGSSLWILAALCFTFLFFKIVGDVTERKSKLIALVLLVIFWMEAHPLEGRNLIVPPPKGKDLNVALPAGGGCYVMPPGQVVRRVTSQGLVMHVPESGDQCWNAPLPCATGLNDRLGLRRQDDLSRGFALGKR
jgi:hypothetical protein